jgi:hypothetical protein
MYVLQHAEIYRPFRIPVNISTAAIRGVLERHGPIVGSFYCSDSLDHYYGVSNFIFIIMFLSKSLFILTHFFFFL